MPRGKKPQEVEPVLVKFTFNDTFVFNGKIYGKDEYAFVTEEQAQQFDEDGFGDADIELSLPPTDPSEVEPQE